MQLGDAGDQRFGAPGGGLEQGSDLAGFLDLALPAVDGMAGAKQVDAGGELFLDDEAADAARFLVAAEGRVDGDDGAGPGHAGRVPSRWAVAAIAASSKAAIAWCDTAIQRWTPLSKVRMPSRIWRKTAPATAAAWRGSARRHAASASAQAKAATIQASQRWTNWTTIPLSTRLRRS